MRSSILAALLAFVAVLPHAAIAENGDHSLKRHTRMFRVGAHPVALVLADLTGDGRPEIITANRGLLANPNEEVPANDEISVLVASEDVNYTHGAQLETGFAPYDIEAVNVDGQRALDLVSVNFMARRGRDLSVFRNLGESKFEPIHFEVMSDRLEYLRHRYPDDEPAFTKPGFTSIAVERIDEDEYRDAIAAGWCSDVLVYFPGTADRIFGEPEFWSAPGGPFDVQVIDLDHDGSMEIVTTYYSAGAIGIWARGEDERFEEVKRFASGGALPHRVRIVDIDGDGHLDLVVSHRHRDDNVVIWYGAGKLRFDRMQKLEAGVDDWAVEHDIRDIAIGDFDGNGRPDIAAAAPVSRQCIVWFQELRDGQPPTFREERYTFKETEGRPGALAAADVDGDGDIDLGVALWDSNVVTFLLSTANDD
jgi:hypothetical protein